MDVTLLRGFVASTLDTNADVRRGAELSLKEVPSLRNPASTPHADNSSQAEVHPGFTEALLNILESEPEASLRLSCTQTDEPGRPPSDNC